MGISHGGYTFEGIDSHSMPLAERPETNDVTDQFMGIKGESEITDSPHGRDIRIRADFIGYSTYALLSAAMSRVEAKQNQITDQTLTFTPIQAGEDPATFVHCTFKGVDYDGEPFLDGSGVNGWIQRTTLMWRQLKTTA